MMFDPDAGRSLEEIILRKWNQEWDAELKAEILQVAHGLSCTWMDVVMACLEDALEDLKDPIVRQRLIRELNRRKTPFGKDPTVNT